MIHPIYQAHSSTFPGLPEGVFAFFGNHTGTVPAAGSTFHRYGRTWTIQHVLTPGPGTWSFRLAATAQPLIPDP